MAGFGGMRDHGERLAFSPRLPSRLARLRFGLVYRGRRLRVEIGREDVRYELFEGDALELAHDGETLTVTPDASQVRPIVLAAQRAKPVQPPGRSPLRRQSG